MPARPWDQLGISRSRRAGGTSSVKRRGTNGQLVPASVGSASASRMSAALVASASAPGVPCRCAQTAPSRLPAVPRVASLIRVCGANGGESIHGCSQPSSVGELREPGDRLLRTVRLQRRQDAEVADQAVEVGVRRRGRQPCPDPRRDAVRQRLLLVGPRPGLADLGQHVGEPADPAVHPVAVLGRAAVVRHGPGIHGPSSSHRTWSSTQRQAASPRSAYVSEVVMPAIIRSSASSTRVPTGRPWSS